MPTFDTPNTQNSYTVPTSADEIFIAVDGAAGGEGGEGYSFQDYTPGDGGLGGYIDGMLPVNGGETLTINVAETGGKGGQFTGSTSDSTQENGGSAGQSPAENGDPGDSGEYDTDFDGDDFRAAGGGGGGGETNVILNGTIIAQAGGGGGGVGSNFDTSAGDLDGGDGGAGGPTSGSGGSGGSGDSTSSTKNGENGGVSSGGSFSVGDTAHSSGTASVEIVVPPDAPSSASQSIHGDDDIEVSWPEVDVSADYDVDVQADGGQWQRAATVAAPPYSYAADPSANEHRFRVRAANRAGDSDWAYTQTQATDPTELVASADGYDGVSLDWTAVPDASNYRVLRSQSSGSTASDYDEVATPTSPSYADGGLSVATKYYYRVQAVYTGTDSQLSDEAVVTTEPVPPVLDGLDTSTVGEVTVSWSLQDDSSEGSVEIYRSTDGSLGSLVNTIADLSTTQWTDTGVQDGTTYHYTVRRVVNDQSADSDQQSATTILPAPTELDAVDVRDTEADVEWTATHDNGETRVEVREDDDGDWSVDQAVSYDTEQATIEGLLNGQLYGVRVVADTGDAEEVDQ